MKMTIYVPDDLAELVKEHSDLNVSAVCQDALRHELARRDQLAKLDRGMERVVTYVEKPYGGDVAFIGKMLHYQDRPETAVYLTQKHRIAVEDIERQELHQYNSFDDFADECAGSPELVSAVAAALGEKHVTELDI